jgi:hypothetical protein
MSPLQGMGEGAVIRRLKPTAMIIKSFFDFAPLALFC